MECLNIFEVTEHSARKKTANDHEGVPMVRQLAFCRICIHDRQNVIQQKNGPRLVYRLVPRRTSLLNVSGHHQMLGNKTAVKV